MSRTPETRKAPPLSASDRYRGQRWLSVPMAGVPAPQRPWLLVLTAAALLIASLIRTAPAVVAPPVPSAQFYSEMAEPPAVEQPGPTTQAIPDWLASLIFFLFLLLVVGGFILGIFTWNQDKKRVEEMKLRREAVAQERQPKGSDKDWGL